MRSYREVRFQAHAGFNEACRPTKLDWTLVGRLNAALGDNEEGCLLDVPDDFRVREQTLFLSNLLLSTQPGRVVEIGTHKAMFCYIARLCLPNVGIDTFGNLPESSQAVRILNEYFGKFATFHLGLSEQTFTQFLPPYQIDLAWVDGSHSYEACLGDLTNCARLGIPHVAVDDCDKIPDVSRAVGEFVKLYGYRMVSRSSPVYDYRGIQYFRK